MIFARCRRVLRDDALAEDATQELFLRFMRCGELPNDRVAARWISLVARNYCLNMIRMRRVHAVPMEELPELPSGDLEAELDDRRFSQLLFQKVPHSVRAPAAMRFVDGVSQEETARRLGISLRTVSSRMNAFASSCRALLAARAQELARA
jgi:RNA polymerase sigma-70 factor (ECF subfamily)